MYIKGPIFGGKRYVSECTAKSLKGHTPEIHRSKTVCLISSLYLSLLSEFFFFGKDCYNHKSAFCIKFEIKKKKKITKVGSCSLSAHKFQNRKQQVLQCPDRWA